MKKILYIANIRLPTEKAHGIQIMEMCNALSQVGAEVELCVPKRKNPINKDSFEYYDIPKSFRITYLPTFDLVRFGRAGFLLQALSFSLSVLFYTHKKHDEILYSRDEFPLWVLSFFKQSFIFEIHSPRWNFISRRVIKYSKLLIPISYGLKNFYNQQGIFDEQMLVGPDGVSARLLAVTKSKEECRTLLSLPQGVKITLYAGHLYERKGAHIFAKAAQYLEDDTLCIFVGGTKGDIQDFQKNTSTQKNILILGHRPHKDIAYYLRAADVLILPNSARDADARLYTSPMKLFEYMASGSPVVASDVPSLREILNEQNAFFVLPDDPNALALGIKEILNNPDIGKKLATHAREDVSNFTWEKRAENILKRLN